jgi:membrane-bound lytic murein transglycosylase F
MTGMYASFCRFIAGADFTWLLFIRPRDYTRWVGLCVACFLSLAGCGSDDSLQRIKDSGELRVISRNGPTTYYEDKNGSTGFEYALASLLADDLGVTLEMSPSFSLAAIFEGLTRGEADLAAAGLTLTPERAAHFPHSEPYYKLKPQVIYKSGSFRPRSIADLAGMKILTISDSSHAKTLQALAEGSGEFLEVEQIKTSDSMELLHLVVTGEAPLAIMDSNEFTVQQALFPRLRVAFDIGKEQELTWYLTPTTDNSRLLARISRLFEHLEQNGTMERLRQSHFVHARGVTRIGSHTFNRNMRKTLPKYTQMFKQVAKEYQLDRHLLAAIAYQESHWDPLATSPTGVRGMMMLTRPTAKEMGVKNRLDALQSLRGGARYLKNMKRRLPQRIGEPNLTWFALAAYNVGLGHLEDARVLTQRQGGDPDVWADVIQRLPLLQQSNYYQTLRHGYARGSEPVTYVENIRHYYRILQWQDIAQNKPMPPLQTDEYLPKSVGPGVFSAL